MIIFFKILAQNICHMDWTNHSSSSDEVFNEINNEISQEVENNEITQNTDLDENTGLTNLNNYY